MNVAIFYYYGHPPVGEKGNNMELYEFYNGDSLYDQLLYWSNALGELQYHGWGTLEEEDLPAELQRAYRDLWNEGSGSREYLTEYGGNYYVCLSVEYSADFADYKRESMDAVYESIKEKALRLANSESFSNTILILGKETGFDECHEIHFLVPAMEREDVFRELEKKVRDTFWEEEYYAA